LVDFVRARLESERPYDYTGTMHEVLELNAAVERRGGRLAVAAFRTARQYPPWLKLVATATSALQGTGIPFIDLGPSLFAGGQSEADLAVHAIDGHPNEMAHRRAAVALEAFLREAGQLEPQASASRGTDPGLNARGRRQP
jgi:hypothetical protein